MTDPMVTAVWLIVGALVVLYLGKKFADWLIPKRRQEHFADAAAAAERAGGFVVDPDGRTCIVCDSVAVEPMPMVEHERERDEQRLRQSSTVPVMKFQLKLQNAETISDSVFCRLCAYRARTLLEKNVIARTALGYADWVDSVTKEAVRYQSIGLLEDLKRDAPPRARIHNLNTERPRVSVSGIVTKDETLAERPSTPPEQSAVAELVRRSHVAG
jgi:hypothetical protein